MSISTIVELFRKVERPQIVSGCFSFEGHLTDEIAKVGNAALKEHRNLFYEIEADGNDISQEKILPAAAKRIEFNFKLPTGDPSRFYDSISSMLTSCPQISRGEMPAEFYLLDIDFFSRDKSEVAEISKLRTICKLINCISKLAHYHDARRQNKLIFMPPNEQDKAFIKAIELETIVTHEMLLGGDLNISIIESLSDENQTSDHYYSARVSVFRSSIVEFLKLTKDEKNLFKLLVNGWTEFTQLYNNNIDTYLSGFAFHRAKKEVADAEVNLADQFSKIITEITGKLFAIPLSLGAVVAITKPSSPEEKFLLITGLGFATLIFSGSIDNQKRHLKRVSHAKSIIIGALEGRKEGYPKDLQTTISQMKNSLDANEKKLGRLLNFFRVLGWVPFPVGVIFFILYL